MSFIRYFERAQPGKKRKIENEKTEKSKEYEARCKERSFNQQRLVGRPRLSFNSTENTMKTVLNFVMFFGQANFFACLTECRARVFNFQKDCSLLNLLRWMVYAECMHETANSLCIHFVYVIYNDQQFLSFEQIGFKFKVKKFQTVLLVPYFLGKWNTKHALLFFCLIKKWSWFTFFKVYYEQKKSHFYFCLF